jgi:hypothetical protein
MNSLSALEPFLRSAVARHAEKAASAAKHAFYILRSSRADGKTWTVQWTFANADVQRAHNVLEGLKRRRRGGSWIVLFQVEAGKGVANTRHVRGYVAP